MTDPDFPKAETEFRLRRGLVGVAAGRDILRKPWEPELDSLSIISIIIEIENLFPFDLPADRLVRKGGYSSVEEATQDIMQRLKEIWDKKLKKKEAA